MDEDSTYDIAAGTQDTRVYWWANDGIWTRTLIHTNQDYVRSLRVADIDGDYWDDIVIATEDGYIRWYRNDKGRSWRIIVIEQLGTGSTTSTSGMWIAAWSSTLPCRLGEPAIEPPRLQRSRIVTSFRTGKATLWIGIERSRSKFSRVVWPV